MNHEEHAHEDHLHHETSYPTDMTNAAWALIASYIAPDPPIGSPHDGSMRCVVNALFYWIKTACQGKLLPTNFPAYSTVNHHFRYWSADGTNALPTICSARSGVTPARSGPEP